MEEISDSIYKILNVDPDYEISVINITKILGCENKLNKLIQIISKAMDLKEIKKLKLNKYKNSVENFLKNFLKQDFKIDQCFKYIIENQYRVRCKIWILYKKDLSKINGSDISDETIDEMEDSADFDNIKNKDYEIKELQKKINSIEDNILNPVWEDRIINKISLKINERISYLISSIDNLSQSINFEKDYEKDFEKECEKDNEKDCENKLNDSSMFV